MLYQCICGKWCRHMRHFWSSSISQCSFLKSPTASRVLKPRHFLRCSMSIPDYAWCHIRAVFEFWFLAKQGSTQFASSVDSMVSTIQNSTLALACKEFKLGILQEYVDRKAGRQQIHMTEVLTDWCESVQQALNTFNKSTSHECDYFSELSSDVEVDRLLCQIHSRIYDSHVSTEYRFQGELGFVFNAERLVWVPRFKFTSTWLTSKFWQILSANTWDLSCH